MTPLCSASKPTLFGCGSPRRAKSWRGRRAQQQRRAGSRAYLSSGLPGADWWVAGAAEAKAEDAEVELAELAEVKRFFDENDLWSVLG